MNSTWNAPHQGRPAGLHGAPNAALLIDFDNVTMGIRSDLTKELKNLLNSDVIRGKVAVQRAYADWRRYPQYIVPLAEASVDLIFAPAYGSSKKNATDIRMAIDGLELVFTRPEIGVFILLSGDSDFSSLVLKLKEYGKYVIGVGIKESSSDLLVQNCDEYYSYNALTGLTKAGDEKPTSAKDPWDLVEAAIGRMVEQNDVMRSDRLKQVMLEMDEAFDEKEIGYTKYNKFLTDAAGRGKLKLRKLENGQFEVGPAPGGRSAGRGRAAASTGGRSAESTRGDRSGSQASAGAPTLDESYDLLRRAVKDLGDSGSDPVRDSDVKRRMLEIRSEWDESAVGFSKFSHFLRQAHNSEIIDLRRASDGAYHVVVPTPPQDEDEPESRGGESVRDTARMRSEGRRDSRGGSSGRGNGRGRGRGRDREERESRPDRDEQPRQEREERDTSRSEREEPRQQAREERPAAPQRQEQPAAPRREEQPAASKPGGQPAASQKDERDATERGQPARGAAESGQRQVEQQKAAAESRATEAPTTAPAGTSGQAPAAEPQPRGVGRGIRGGRRGTPAGPPPLLEGQTVSLGTKPSTTDTPTAPAGEPAPAPGGRAESERSEMPSRGAGATGGGAQSDDEPIVVARVEIPGLEDALDARELGLPTDSGAVQRYLTNRYRGVGERTAEAVVEAFGAEHVFAALHAAPDRVVEVLGGGRRATALVEAWQEDYARRAASSQGDAGAGSTAGAGVAEDDGSAG